MLADFHFIRPEWLIALPFVLLTAVLFARRRLGPGSWEFVVDPQLAPHVLSGSQANGIDSRWILLGVTGVLGVLALAGPAWERIEQPMFRSEQALVVALDLSRSMDAQDVAPSRLLRARLKILDLLQRRASGQTALIVYSANAFTVTPLTTDSDTVAALVNSLGTDIMPSRGSYPLAAINKGRALLEQAGMGYGEVLLITDGGSTPATERAARDLRDAGYSLSVLGVGTTDGAPIPRATGGFVTDQMGQIAVARLEETSLRALATAGGGRYATLTSDNRDLDLLLSGETTSRSATDETQGTDRWREEGPWLLLLLLPLAAMSFRRGWAIVLLVFVLPLAQPAQASLWDDMWHTRNQQAQERLEEGDVLAAAELFDDGEWQAVSRYRGGEFAESAAKFAAKDDTRNLYNLGNAMAMQGEFESALDAYEQVLKMEPDNADAKYNRDLMDEMLQEQQSQQEGESQDSDQESGGESEESDGENESDQQNSDNSEQSASDEGDPTERAEDEDQQKDLDALQEELERAAEAQNNSESEQQLTDEQLEELRRAQEEQQAMEQWLRRIPHDPGRLLRTKFRYQYKRSGKDQDGNDLWPDDEVQPW
ncbi:MAG: VWA domain-containing protein [Proteobacteria bacterium]|nr:VWA domain-containing protein [Pseudomonadota bacterium]